MKKALAAQLSMAVIVISLNGAVTTRLFAQGIPQDSERQVREADSSKSVILFNKGLKFASSSKNDSALFYFDEARRIATANGFKLLEAKASSEMASIYVKSTDMWEPALRHLIIAEVRYKEIDDSASCADIYNTIGQMYISEQIFSTAALYFKQEYLMTESQAAMKKGVAAKKAAETFALDEDFAGAVAWFDSAGVWFRKSNNISAITEVTNALVPLLIQNKSYDKALELVMQAINSQNDGAKNSEISTLHNNAGFLKVRKGEYDDALVHFKKAEELSLMQPTDERALVDIYTNMAVCYQTLEKGDQMINYFTMALKLATDNTMAKEQAHIEMLMAVIYLNRGDLHNAEYYCLACTTSAIISKSYETLQVCYEKYAEVLEEGNDFVSALDLSQKNIAIRDSLLFVDRRAQQEKEEKRLRYERIENRLRVETADEDVFANTIRRLRADSLSQTYNLELIKSQSEFEKEKNTSLNLSLSLALKSAEAQKERMKTDSLRLENISQENELKQKEATEMLLVKEKDLLESQKNQSDLLAQKEAQKKKMAFYIAVLMVLTVIGALYSLVSARRKNLKLAESKKKIEEINSDLEVKNSEIVLQKEIIEQKNQSITDSIQYASRIQNAVLPPLNFLSDWGVENFIFFKPKDIVSGDFYWGFRKKGRIYIAAADCTGHGVPGGFMSMLGNAFLNEILITSEIATASEILDKLRDEIIRALRQKGIMGEARDGMDISIAIIDRKTDYIQYAGANNPLYHIRDGELTRYQADRMPIGIHVKEIAPFTNHKINVKKGDLIYLFSDGFADQFGGENGKKFMYRQFQEVLTSGSGLPMNEQVKQLDETFKNWRGEHDQVDDVLVIGFKIR